MNYKVPATLLVTAFFLGALPCFAQRGGGGHASGGSSGHSFGHIFGSHSGGHGGKSGPGKSSAAPSRGGSMTRQNLIQPSAPRLPGPQPLRFHRPISEFGFGNRLGFLGFGLGDAFGSCSPFYGFPSADFFGGDFDCFGEGSFFDPFFFGATYPGTFGGVQPAASAVSPMDSGDAADGYPEMTAEDANYYATTLTNSVSSPRKAAKPKPLTLLQLTDGSMYGLTDYWVVDGSLRYVTDYGGENSLPLSRIDFTKTNQLNAERGVKFYVQPDSASASH